MYRFINLLEQRLYIFSQHHSPNYILKDIRKKLKSLCFESIIANNIFLTSSMFINIYWMIFKSVFVLFKMFNLSQFIFHMTFYKSHPYFQKDEARNKARVSDGIIGNRKVDCFKVLLGMGENFVVALVVNNTLLNIFASFLRYSSQVVQIKLI